MARKSFELPASALTHLNERKTTVGKYEDVVINGADQKNRESTQPHIDMTPALAEHMQNLVALDQHGLAMEQLAGPERQERREQLIRIMEQRELGYLDRYRKGMEKKNPGNPAKVEEAVGALETRYRHSSASREGYLASVKRDVGPLGIVLDATPESLQGVDFTQDYKGEREPGKISKTETALQNIVDTLFGSDKEKKQIMQKYTSDLVKYMHGSQEERSINTNITAADVYKLGAELISSAYRQDVVSAGNELGTHGAFHIINHNVNFGFDVLNKLKSQGVNIPNSMYLEHMVAMAVHDEGYAVDIVAKDMAVNGPKGQDTGHPMIGGLHVRQAYRDQNSPYNKIFKPSSMDRMQDYAIHHDKAADGTPGIKLKLSPEDFVAWHSNVMTEEARQRLGGEVMRISDNTDFNLNKVAELYRLPTLNGTEDSETKYPPELLWIKDYSPYMALKELQIIGECLDDMAQAEAAQMIAMVKERLTTYIDFQTQNGKLSEAIGKSARDAAQNLSVASFKFSIPRLSSSIEPTFAFAPDGRPQITVKYSEKKHELIRLYGIEKVTKQVEKAYEDLSGKEIPPNANVVDTGDIIYIVEPGTDGEGNGDLDTRVNQATFENGRFMDLANADRDLGREQRVIEDILGNKEITDEELRKFAEGLQKGLSEQPMPMIRATLVNRVDNYKLQRMEILKNHLGPATGLTTQESELAAV